VVEVKNKLTTEDIKNFTSWQKPREVREYIEQKLEPLEPKELKEAEEVKNKGPELVGITQRGVSFDV
jgi:cytochrome b involved in lipid metabolism